VTPTEHRRGPQSNWRLRRGPRLGAACGAATGGGEGRQEGRAAPMAAAHPVAMGL